MQFAVCYKVRNHPKFSTNKATVPAASATGFFAKNRRYSSTAVRFPNLRHLNPRRHWICGRFATRRRMQARAGAEKSGRTAADSRQIRGAKDSRRARFLRARYARARVACYAGSWLRTEQRQGAAHRFGAPSRARFARLGPRLPLRARLPPVGRSRARVSGFASSPRASLRVPRSLAPSAPISSYGVKAPGSLRVAGESGRALRGAPCLSASAQNCGGFF